MLIIGSMVHLGLPGHVHVIEASKFTMKIAGAVCGVVQKQPIDSSHSSPVVICCQQAPTPACQLWKDTVTVHGRIRRAMIRTALCAQERCTHANLMVTATA